MHPASAWHSGTTRVPERCQDPCGACWGIWTQPCTRSTARRGVLPNKAFGFGLSVAAKPGLPRAVQLRGTLVPHTLFLRLGLQECFSNQAPSETGGLADSRPASATWQYVSPRHEQDAGCPWFREDLVPASVEVAKIDADLRTPLGEALF